MIHNMKTATLLLALAAFAYAQEDSCPAYTDWMDWTDKCLWFPFTQIRDDLIDACDVKVTNLDQMPTMPSPPEGFPTEACGHCSFKARCRKREKTDECHRVDIEQEHCHDGAAGDVCTLPKIVRPDYNIGCRYAVVPMLLKQCANRPDVPEWRREQANHMQKIIPKFHCQEDGDNCQCCCHPYVPSADGTACEMHEEPTCEDWSDWTDWSEKCLFFPPSEMKADLEEHCDFEFPAGKGEHPLLSKFKLPGGLEPERCGMCSFKVKCRQRSIKSAADKKECFPLDLDKKACGNDECEGCGDVCELPKLPGPDGCDYNAKIRKIIGPAIKSRLKKMPVMMRHNLVKMILGMPHGKCIDVDGKCMCCCHPYEPNADGTQCVVKDICKAPEELGVEFDMNMPEDDSFAWLF